MPEGTLVCKYGEDWIPAENIGQSADWYKEYYAVPITKQEEVTLHEPITREALNKALRERDEARAEAREILRDKFAMAALTGIVAKIPYRVNQSANREEAMESELLSSAANGAYLYADAMLAARNNQPEKV